MIAAIIVAGGKGRRMESSRPKQFLLLHNRPILTTTLQVFDRCRVIDKSILVLPEADIDIFHTTILPAAGLQRDITVVAGGLRRQDSVMRGLRAVDDQEGLVLIHDGVRPLVTVKLIEAVVDGAHQWGACIPAVQAVDTMKQVDEKGRIVGTPPRETLRTAQTPQGFRLSLIRKAHEKAIAEGRQATDDASLVEAFGETVHVIEGDRKNIKITTPEDLAVAEAYVAMQRQGG